METTDDSARPRRSALKPARFREETPIGKKKDNRGRKRGQVGRPKSIPVPEEDSVAQSDDSFEAEPPAPYQEAAFRKRKSAKKARSSQETEPYKTSSDEYPDDNDIPTTSASSKEVLNHPNPFLFERELGITPEGHIYTTVIPDRMTEFFHKSTIIELCTNQEIAEKARRCGWLLSEPPGLPPMTTGQGCFVFLIDGAACCDANALSADDLRPWTAQKSPHNERLINIKPNVRRHPIALFGDKFTIVTKECGLAEYYLTEYSARLPREERLRKKIFYMSRNNRSYGNVLIIYNYVEDGAIPEVLPQVMSTAPKLPTPPPKLKPTTPKMPKTAPKPATTKPKPAFETHFLSLELQKEVFENERRTYRPILTPNRPTLNKAFHPDSMGTGYDDKFESEEEYSRCFPIGYYDEARTLSTGHCYLTVSNMKVATNFQTVLDWILNSDEVEQREIANATRPHHPPLVTNERAYAFFVLGTSVETQNMTNDNLSPWSSNGTQDNPTCYRTRVRKIGVVNKGGKFVMAAADKDYKQFPFHLVFLYATNPKNTRLIKRIYYVMDAEAKLVISYALIIYEYRVPGDIVKLNSSAPFRAAFNPLVKSRSELTAWDRSPGTSAETNSYGMKTFQPAAPQRPIDQNLLIQRRIPATLNNCPTGRVLSTGHSSSHHYGQGSSRQDEDDLQQIVNEDNEYEIPMSFMF